MCQERTPGDGNLVGIDPEERKIIEKDNTYQIFELQENLQNIYLETMELLSQWFIDKILEEEKEYI